MSFVNPFFLLGALAAGIPILLHLIKRERALRIEFPSLMFLRRVSRKTIRYQKVRHLLLLLMRILTILFLVLAFLRPYRDVSQAAAYAGRTTAAHVILLDNSMSMAYGDRWERARKAAADVAAALQGGDRVALIEFSDQALVRIPLTGERGAVLEDLQRGIQLTDRPTKYTPALRAAEKVALDARTGRRVIDLVSDFQKTGWAADEQGFRLGAGIELRRVDVGSDDYSNLTIGDVRVIEGTGSAAGSLKLKFSLVNFGTQDRKNVRVSLSLDGHQTMENRTDVGRGGVQAGEFDLPGLTAGAHQVILEAEDSNLARDNRYSLMLETRGLTQVLAVEDSSSMWQDSMAAEGWGLYSEALLAEPQEKAPHGFYTPEERLYQLRGQLYRDLRVRIDTGIHTGRLSFEEAVSLFSQVVDFQPGSCQREVGGLGWQPR